MLKYWQGLYSVVPRHNKMFKFKKILRENHETQDFVILVQVETKFQCFSYWDKE